MGMVLDGVAASEQPDSSAEVVNIKGVDISDLVAGRATLNWEHLGEKDPGHSANDHIGRIIYAKKLFQRSECENARQREYWDFVQVPYIYIKAELFDAEGHPGAVAAAAMIRHYRNKGLPILVRYSIEGSTLDQEGPHIKRSIARRVAATIKPANKSAISGVISDGDSDPKKAAESTAADDPLAFLVGTKKHEHPDQKKLGGSATIACDPEVSAAQDLTEKLVEMKKTISAGGYNAAPGSLVGGAALQREELHGVHDTAFRNKAKAALRDYDPDSHGEFRKYIKHQLPEASDEFLDRFAEAVGDWKVTRAQILSKAEDDESGGRITRSGSGMSTGSTAFEAKQKKYQKKLSTIREGAQQGALPGMGAETARAIPPAETAEFKVRGGKRLSRGDAYFDQLGGVLHTADGKFKVYIPDENDRGYGEILRDPHLNRIHDTALKNWMMVHRMLRDGSTPPEVVALGALFSAMSPNTAVPVQELAYGHLMDMMGAPTGTGHFEGLDPTIEQGRKELARYGKEWNAISKGQKLPAWERDHFAHQGAIFTKEGQRHKIGLGSQKWAGVKNYHEIHKVLTDLVSKHGPDARAIAAKLNDMKARAGTKAAGDDPEVKSFAPKTIRYLLGMLGGGNVVVPDTHFIRHTFGLHLADPKSDVLKKYLWNEHNEPLLAELDQFYLNHHPAVTHTRRKLQEQFGEDLGEQSLFPSFWLHWLTIQPHERRRGWFDRGQAKNADTDHAVYWNAVRRVMDKYGIPYDHSVLKKNEFEDDGSMAVRAAHATKELEHQFGFVPATFALYGFMMPAVLNRREALVKADSLADKLQALVKAEPGKQAPKKVQLVPFKGKTVLPGELEILTGPQKGTKHKLVEVGDKYHFILNDSGHLMKAKANSPYYRINSKPVTKGFGFSLVDPQKHGVPGLSEHPDQTALLHGMDLAKEALPTQPGQMSGHSGRQTGTSETGWRTGSKGHIAYVKPAFAMDDMIRPDEHEGFTTAHREAAFHKLARDFFKLGAHVPVTAAFSHPVSGQPYSAQKMVRGAEHYEPTNSEHNALLEHLGFMGSLDKLALMDMVLGNNDRHHGNFVLTPGQAPYLHLIDNGLSMLPDDGVTRAPTYWRAKGHEDTWHDEPLHPDAVAWAQKLSPNKMMKMMREMGMPRGQMDEAAYRLRALQERLGRGSATRGAAFYSPRLALNPHTSTDNLLGLMQEPSTSQVDLSRS